MKICLFFLLVSVATVSASVSYSQNTRLTLNLHNASIQDLIKEIENQSEFIFVFYDDVIDLGQKISIKADNQPVEKILEKVLGSTGNTFAVFDRQIVIGKKNPDPNDNSSTLSGLSDVEQKKELTGQVTDKQNLPIPGASIVIKGTTTGIITDTNGQFRLQYTGEAKVLIISFVGMKTAEIVVGGKSVINVLLEEETVGIEEVVAVGYGVQKKSSVTAAISSVSTKELVQSPQANISNMLVGRLPGLIAVQQSGEPGFDESTLRIRGTGTFSTGEGASSPLIMVDGIERPNYNDIDPNEIDNVSILKDASATALYGVRGANGVILITTRRGKTSTKPTVSYSGNYAIKTPTMLPQFLNSYDYASLLNEALKNDAYTTGSPYIPRFTDQDLELYKNGQDPLFHPDVDWVDLFVKDFSSQKQHNLNISGGTKDTRYFISASYLSQDGIYNSTDMVPDYDLNAKYDRYNFRSNLDFDITSRFSASVTLSGVMEDSNYPNTAASTLFRDLSWANPLSTPGIVDGKVVRIQGKESQVHPVATLLGNGNNKIFRSTITSSVKLNHKLDFITKGLSVYSVLSYDNYYSHGVSRPKNIIQYTIYPDPANTTEAVFIPQGEDTPLGYSASYDKNRKTYVEAGINYDNTFGSHTVTGLILYNQSKSYDPDLAFLVPNAYQGVTSRVTYNFKNKYLAEFNMGYNGTENFAEGMRFGFFPSYSLSWIPTEESFFPKNKIVSFLKFRGSYGEVGNDKIGGDRFLYLPSSYNYQTSNAQGYWFGTVGSTYNKYTGVREGKIGNPDLTWERSQKTNVGLELGLLKNRKLSFIGDYFYEFRDNILANRGTIPNIVGANLPAYNLGRMENSGYEFEFTFRDKFRSLNYWVKGNYTYAHNKVLFRDEAPKTYTYQNETGNRAGQFFGLVDEGFFNSWDEVNDPNRPVYAWHNNKLQPGDIKYKDVNLDGKINLDDRMPIGYSNIPEIVYGLSFGFDYKGFDMSILFQGADNVSTQFFGRSMYPFINGENSAKTVILERWTQERYDAGLPINFPRLGLNPNRAVDNNYQESTYWSRDADYVRLKNLEIGCRFDSGILKKLNMSSLRVFVNGTNLLTWSHSDMFDPEAPANRGGGQDAEFYYYPQMVTYNFGINVQF